jgi:hypothetical protein
MLFAAGPEFVKLYHKRVQRKEKVHETKSNT